MKRTYEVTLRVTIDPYYVDPPSEWSWSQLLSGEPNNDQCSIEFINQTPQTGAT